MGTAGSASVAIHGEIGYIDLPLPTRDGQR